jgi:hypothetical protein
MDSAMSARSQSRSRGLPNRLSGESFRTVAIVILGLSTLMCSAREVEPTAIPPSAFDFERRASAAKHFALSNAGSYEVSWQPLEGELTLYRWFTIQVKVSDRTLREPIAADVNLSVAGGSSDQGQAMNRIPLVTRTGPGTFLVEGLFFNAPGRWELHFDLTRFGETERTHFEVEVL